MHKIWRHTVFKFVIIHMQNEKNTRISKDINTQNSAPYYLLNSARNGIQVIKKNNNKISPSSIFGFDCFHHKYACDIFSKDFFSSTF